MASLELHNWPGNVRELEHVVERMVILAEPNLEAITPALLPLEIRPPVLDNAEPVPAGKSSEGVKTMKDAYEKCFFSKLWSNRIGINPRPQEQWEFMRRPCALK